MTSPTLLDGDSDPTVRLLNKVFAVDANAIASLLEMRVPVNNSLASDPAFIVSEHGPGQYRLSVLGFLNAILHSCGKNCVAIVYEDNEKRLSAGFVAVEWPDKPLVPSTPKTFLNFALALDSLAIAAIVQSKIPAKAEVQTVLTGAAEQKRFLLMFIAVLNAVLKANDLAEHIFFPLIHDGQVPFFEEK